MTLTNNSGEERLIRQLDARSVSFWFGRATDEERMRRNAVASDQEALGGNDQVGARPAHRNAPFLLTRLTQFGGDPGMAFTAQVQYDFQGAPAPAQNAAPFQQRGGPLRSKAPRLFERDPEGLIAEADAIRLARESLGAAARRREGPVPCLIRDEKGFVKWWIKRGGTQRRARRVR